jgi:outer membrane protein W
VLPRSRTATSGASLLALLVFSHPGRASAEQRELQIGLQPVYGITYADDRSPSGGGGNLQVSYGITDALAIQVHGGLTAHPLDADMDKMLPAGLLMTWHASAGIMYSLDIVRIVPYFEASLGVLGVTTRAAGTVKNEVNVGAEIGLGADYMLSRRWAVGVALRYHAFLTDLSHLPLYLTVGPRVVLRFGL